MTKTIQFVVIGRVQGVFFRASTRNKAMELSIQGWVKNRLDGKVEGKAAGKPEDIQKFTDWLRSGPDMARVDDLIVTIIEPEDLSEFRIL